MVLDHMWRAEGEWYL